MTQTFTWLFTGLLILSLITVVAGLISTRCKEIDHDPRRLWPFHPHQPGFGLHQPGPMEHLRRLRLMSFDNPFTEWKRRLPLAQLQDIRRWYGVPGGDSSCDADIGMTINGIACEYLFSSARRVERLRRGFVPRLSSIATAVKIVTGNSSFSFKPGKALKGQDVSPRIVWDAVDTDKTFSRLIRDIDVFIVSGLIDRHLTKSPDSKQIIDWRTSPEPPKSGEDIMQDLESCQLAVSRVVEAERRRNLTNGQIMQLCAYFRLYSYQEIIDFIEEHKR